MYHSTVDISHGFSFCLLQNVIINTSVHVSWCTCVYIFITHLMITLEIITNILDIKI